MKSMKPGEVCEGEGSVTVDLAAEAGGNIATMVANEVINHKASDVRSKHYLEEVSGNLIASSGVSGTWSCKVYWSDRTHM